jgi:hypothetical protein
MNKKNRARLTSAPRKSLIAAIRPLPVAALITISWIVCSLAESRRATADSLEPESEMEDIAMGLKRVVA